MAAVSQFANEQALIFAGLGDKDRTLEALERMGSRGPQRVGRFLTYPEFAFSSRRPAPRSLAQEGWLAVSEKRWAFLLEASPARPVETRATRPTRTPASPAEWAARTRAAVRLPLWPERFAALYRLNTSPMSVRRHRFSNTNSRLSRRSSD